MKRRTLLVGTAGLCAALAGCTGDGNGGESPTETETTTSPTETPKHPRLVERSFSPQTADDCPDDGKAQVTYTKTGATVSGCLWGRNGCAVARLARADYDVESDVATVVVKTVVDAEPDEVCTQALVTRGYELTLSFEAGLPGRVVVIHDDVNGRREVARRDRSD
ncbi:hypothetical protein E6P09_05505 [Haloferax mediterranei ATCC 33500]|uniref:Lipoprotein n=1 Tax=Haloferax mediterranei (strain ATCC 33500 / DSM 1411 / JCM 8866 / NBRC 14739 / NCIMB 2177 / R-4) TaxID=523841 RepID=I3R1W2_HALMT|nr:hypothetical protein [Haloferax mediterranei]AFK18222.1 hypothetical protein HFX_0491 [Haloferax mediterranei ATCC 33500]AHZ22377.1 hypothetical protein BM92_06815 [Haloferax mediterranei ATCC 33500]EMA02507.1 hypothetical protein C439_07990 [Haloferax mediterranei ATCC 33500]MDX5988310.1 hypothetical protein [Haloferax mediterranei ATCC 33500]QCQ74745.1 hypothetical protein E6P09_05505 [Haloferax mediterranei ATCC 33500]